MTAHLEQSGARIAVLEAEVAALRARLGRDSTNSSILPSADSLAAKGKRKVARSQRVRSADRKRVGSPGRKGSGLTPTPDPDRTERVEGLELGTLLGAPVSSGFVARAQQRLADVLDAAGLDEAMKRSLRAEPVLGADESPVNIVAKINAISGRRRVHPTSWPCAPRMSGWRCCGHLPQQRQPQGPGSLRPVARGAGT